MTTVVDSSGRERSVPEGVLTFTSRMKVHPEYVDEFVRALTDCSKQAAEAEGNVVLFATQSAEDPTVFLMFEQWTSYEAFETGEMNEPYFASYIAKTNHFHATPRDVELWTVLDLG